MRTVAPVTSVRFPLATEIGRVDVIPVDAGAPFSPDVQLLRRGRWFGSLPAELQSLVIERSFTRSYKSGAHIVREGRRRAACSHCSKGECMPSAESANRTRH